MQTKLSIELNGPYGQLMYEKIGEGSFSTVYRTVPGTASMHALKKPSQYNVDTYVTYRRELEVLSLFVQPYPHPNIIKFIQGFYEERPHLFINNTYLAFECANREDLMSYLSESASFLPSRIRYKILLGVAQGLDHLHTNCLLIHRDLKAENVVLDFCDHEIVPKIVDFGMSFSIPSTDAVLDNVPCGGSPPYISPETLAERSCSVKSDVYAFSILMYVMIHFSYPLNTFFSSEHIDEMKQGLELVLQGYREEFSPCISIEDQRMIHDTWAPNPIDRPTARQIVEYLQFVLTSMDLSDVAPVFSFPEKKRLKLWKGPRFGIFDRQENVVLTTADSTKSSEESLEEAENSYLGFLTAWLSAPN